LIVDSCYAIATTNNYPLSTIKYKPGALVEERVEDVSHVEIAKCKMQIAE
jgi:hypothetical protein